MLTLAAVLSMFWGMGNGHMPTIVQPTSETVIEYAVQYPPEAVPWECIRKDTLQPDAPSADSYIHGTGATVTIPVSLPGNPIIRSVYPYAYCNSPFGGVAVLSVVVLTDEGEVHLDGEAITETWGWCTSLDHTINMHASDIQAVRFSFANMVHGYDIQVAAVYVAMDVISTHPGNGRYRRSGSPFGGISR